MEEGGKEGEIEEKCVEIIERLGEKYSGKEKQDRGH